MPALISRLKIMAEMNIVERRRPQDGQFSLTVDGKDVDVRVATVATVFGEKCVLRLLDKSRSMLHINQLGMPEDTYETYRGLVHSPFGMVICAGPTGAGKTTTLYATLGEVNSAGKNIMTIEDPVEYVFAGINQIQTNDQAGIGFATGLKAILRQDPDVILVGEIRDADTARIAIQSALTGHFVLSSLHGTDSVAALHRFLDMGIESFLIASSVVAVVGQRLLRRICDSCKEPYEPQPQDLAFYEEHGGKLKTQFWHGAGCNFCAGTGYRDRIGVYELLRITPEIRRLIVGWATQEELRRLATSQGMRTLTQEAVALVEQDVTTVPEVIRTIYSA
jgi:type IV pilus assembly protein PilB